MSGKKLTMKDAEFIRLFAEFGFAPVPIAKEYEVHPDSVRNILHGKSFRPENQPETPRTNAYRKLSDEQVRKIRQLTEEGHGEQYISSRLDNVVSRSTVRQVMNGVTYKEVV